VTDAREDRDDPLLDSLATLLVAARENIVAWIRAMDQIDEIRELRRQGLRYSDMALSTGPSLIDVVASNQERLTAAAAAYRRASVRQLHAEGMSIADIARGFGVSRQRVANLLHETTADDATGIAPLEQDE